MLSVSARTFFKVEKCLLRMIQTLPVVKKTSVSNDSSWQPEKNNFPAEKIYEVSEIDEFRHIRPKTISSTYINESEILQELFKLNVDLHKVESNEEAYEYIVTKGFDDIKEHIAYLKELNLEETDIGNIITKNPLILKEDIDDLNVRINYLKYKKFTNSMITSIVKKNPLWLSHSTKEIDECLGSIQKMLLLKGDEVRQLATINSRVITYPVDKIKANMFSLKEEMGFTQDEIKQMILLKPKLLMKGRAEVLKTFEYLHSSMNLSHSRIVQECMVLSCRESRLKPRHLFLVKLGRAQYDPKTPNYISLQALVSERDSFFATEVAKSSMQIFNQFLKSL